MPWDDLHEGILADIAGWQVPQEQLAFAWMSERAERRKEQCAEAQRRWLAKQPKPTAARRKACRGYSADWYARLKADPERREARRMKVKAWRARRNDASRA